MNDKQAIELFVAALRKEGRSENTVKNYVSDINSFVKYLGGTRGAALAAAGQKEITQFTHQIEKSGLAKSTVNRKIQSLRTLYAILREQGVIESNPTEKVKSKKVAKQNETKWLDREQVRSIFKAIDNAKQGESKTAQQRAIISILVNCGLRVQELCDIKMNDIDWEAGLLSVNGKGGKFRRVPFNSGTKRNIMKWLQYRNIDGEYLFNTERSDHMTPRAVQHITKKLAEQLNFSFTVHQLRHTALKNVADTTGKLEIVAAVAGHENVNTSRRYVEPSLQEIGDAMRKNEYDF